MRILIVLHQFYPEFSSGTERVALNLAKAAQRAGHHVRVLACAVNPEAHHGAASAVLAGALETVWDGVPVTLLPRAMLPASADYSLEIAPELVAPLAAWMKHERFDLAHVMHSMRMSTAVVAAQQCGLPYIVTLTDFFLACPRINLVTLGNQLCDGPQGGKKCGKDCLSAPWSRDTLVHRYEGARQMLAGASVRVAPSEFVAARYREAFADCSFRVVAHGVDLLALMDHAAPARFDTSTVTLGYVGSIIPQKGLTVLLRALARVKAGERPTHAAQAEGVNPSTLFRALAKERPQRLFLLMASENGGINAWVENARYKQIGPDEQFTSIADAQAAIPGLLAKV